MSTRHSLGIASTALWVGALILSSAQAQVWTFKGVVASGEQSDAAVGPDNRIHLVTSRYYQFDANGNKLVDEAGPAPDQAQNAMDYNPAIAVDGAGTAHLLTRRNGSWGAGYELWYSKRTAAGAWTSYKAVNPTPRNYQVGLAATTAGAVYLSHSSANGDTVWGPVKFYREAAGSMRALGEIADVGRIDGDQLIRARGTTLFFASGKCDSDGESYFSRTAATDNPVPALTANLNAHEAGSGRRGFPAIAVDANGNQHIAYGADGAIFYNRYNAANTKAFASDKQVFGGLGTWHLGVGLCSMAVSENGRRILIVALNPDGQSQAGSNSELRYRYSLDGGNSWSWQAGLARFTTAGEGRCRPTLVSVGDKAFVFYKDNTAKGTSLAILQARPAPASKSVIHAPTPLVPTTSTPTATAYTSWAAARLPTASRTPNDDPDRDGVSNLDEFVADTNPADPASHFTLQAINTDSGATIRFPSSTSRRYTLQFIDDLLHGSWQDAPTHRSLRGSGTTMSLSDPAPPPARLYRLQVTIPDNPPPIHPSPPAPGDR